jgi:hypothetical protein
MTPKQEHDRLFLVVWEVAMNAAAPPIQTAETRIPKDIAEDARALLTDLGYDWQAARREYLAEVAALRQRNYEAGRAERKK